MDAGGDAGGGADFGLSSGEITDMAFLFNVDTLGRSRVDKQQNAWLRELDGERVRLNSELRAFRGSTEQHLTQMSTRMDTFLELSDVRERLAMFPRCAWARSRAALLLDGEVPEDLDLEDVSGYWLVPATRGLHAALSGDKAGLQRGFSTAARRDATRALVFAVLANAATGTGNAPGFADQFLDELLGDLSGDVVRYQRALWLLAADGHLGEAARETAARRISAALEHTSTTGGDDDAWEKAGGPVELPPVPEGLENRKEVVTQLVALERLTALRVWVERSATPSGDGERSSVDPFVTRTLELLLHEGSTEEIPLLHRRSHLRSALGNNVPRDKQPEPDTWTDTVGTAGEILSWDYAQSDVPPERHAFVVRLFFPRIMAAAQQLAQRAKGTVDPKHVTVTAHGREANIALQEGEEEQEGAVRYLTGGVEPERGSTNQGLAYMFLGVAILLVALAFASGTSGAGVLALFAFGACCVFYYRNAQQDMSEGEHATVLHEAQTRVRTAVERGENIRAQLSQSTERADRELATVQQLLGYTPTEGTGPLPASRRSARRG